MLLKTISVCGFYGRRDYASTFKCYYHIAVAVVCIMIVMVMVDRKLMA
jgi:low affinity Fe/Cu permease